MQTRKSAKPSKSAKLTLATIKEKQIIFIVKRIRQKKDEEEEI